MEEPIPGDLSMVTPKGNRTLIEKLSVAIKQRYQIQNPHNKKRPDKRQMLHLTNQNRLRYEAVQVLVSRIFIPSVFGIVNEDLYFN